MHNYQRVWDCIQIIKENQNQIVIDDSCNAKIPETIILEVCEKLVLLHFRLYING